MDGDPCARCDGPGVTFDQGLGRIVACDRCRGLGVEPADPEPPRRPPRPA